MLRRTLLAAAVLTLAAAVHAAPSVGQPAPDFVYAGGIDSIPSAEPGDIRKAVNYVKQGLNEALAGKPITMAATRAYGCSIKYKA
jgi:hypothetical protein